MKLLETLAHPGREFTAMPFWFLNGNLSEQELERQLQDFCEHGIYGVVLHPRMGLPKRVPYLSAPYFRLITAAVEKAHELSMRVVLYDEGMYPSGSACGQVVAHNPAFASRGIALVPHAAPGDTVLAQSGRGVLVARKSGGTLRGIHWGEDDGEKNAPASADILNPDAVDCFIKLTHEKYYKHLARYFGNTIIGFFTDEPSILGRNVEEMFPWSLGFEKEFTAAGGSPENLTALFVGQKNADTALYDQLILSRESESYYKKLSDWCCAHQIALMGHPHQSDDIEVERYFGVPGQDLVLRWLAPEKDGLAGMDSTMGKCSADAAFLACRRRNANECFGACNKDDNPWQFSGGDIKWYLDWLAVRGVNLFIPHAFYYSIVGKRRDERPPDVGPHSIWWKHYNLLSGYMQRLACLMTDIDLAAPVAVLCHNRDLLPEAVRPLFENQVGFRYLPQSAWADCTAENGVLHYRGHKFTTVLGDAAAFPALPRWTPETAPRDCICAAPQPLLRAAHFWRDGTECWLLVNEGNTDIDTDITFPTGRELATYDLWANKAYSTQAAGDPGAKSLPVHLPPRGSLLVFACTRLELTEMRPQPARVLLPPVKFTESPFGGGKKPLHKKYEATIPFTAAQAALPSAWLCLQAEEMAEVYVNGALAGVGFWAPQCFDLKPYLKVGENTIRVVVTGSLANRYGKKPVWFGLQ